MSDSPLLHQRHHEYTYRLPTPPRIVVPPPTLSIAMPKLSVGRANNGPDEEELDISFLQGLDLEDIIQTNTLMEWTYARRREAQLILPWLYLGPMTAAKDRAFLERENITMALAVRTRENSMNGAIQAARGICLQVATIEAPTYLDLIGKFSDATRMINQHVARVREVTPIVDGEQSMGKVLLFCESGNDMSAAVAAAYLMDTLDKFDHIKAMQVCQAQRFCINFDDTIKNILQAHEDILSAKRSVTTSRAQTLASSAATNKLHNGLQLLPLAPKPKRSIEDTMDDDDYDMDDVDPSDAMRFTDRDVTPFQDS
ncbi:hypothetical protein BDV95DRAFT_496048 [Massariosphaeria phaeospora]|uniref:Tyrosine-protein phosphatase domain-containing protein n=1 Tax=Massariosphaeria phaeospora TaxID=100035 RepID=A0A7C8M7L0_9PLEO|nr:hypothetical protein BDV95DRAFT_496048 [Massariosphaeria phaeospora]